MHNSIDLTVYLTQLPVWKQLYFKKMLVANRGAQFLRSVESHGVVQIFNCSSYLIRLEMLCAHLQNFV